MNKPMEHIPHPKLLLDPYGTWAANEGVPITEDFGVDLLKAPVKPWPRFGVDGGIVNLKGRGDFVSIFVLDLAPAAKTSPQKHLYEEVGLCALRPRQHHGRDQRRPQAQLRMGPQEPVRAAAQRQATSISIRSGQERARLASTNNLCHDAQPLPQRSTSSSRTTSNSRSAKAPPSRSAAKASSSRCGPAATCGRRISSRISHPSS